MVMRHSLNLSATSEVNELAQVSHTHVRFCPDHDTSGGSAHSLVDRTICRPLRRRILLEHLRDLSCQLGGNVPEGTFLPVIGGGKPYPHMSYKASRMGDGIVASDHLVLSPDGLGKATWFAREFNPGYRNRPGIVIKWIYRGTNNFNGLDLNPHLESGLLRERLEAICQLLTRPRSELSARLLPINEREVIKFSQGRYAHMLGNRVVYDSFTYEPMQQLREGNWTSMPLVPWYLTETLQGSPDMQHGSNRMKSVQALVKGAAFCGLDLIFNQDM